MRHLPKLIKALELSGNEYSVGDVMQSVLRGDAQSWENDGGWIITKVIDTPRQRSVHFWLAAGEMEAVMEIQSHVLAWAKSIGCTKATMHGRKGWLRVLGSEGWRQPDKLIVLEREL